MSSWSIRRKSNDNFRKWKIKKRTRVRSENEKDINEPLDNPTADKCPVSDPTAEETNMSDTYEPKYEPEEQIPAEYSDDVNLVIFHNGEFVLMEDEATGIKVLQKDDNPYDYFDEIGLYRCFLHYDDENAYLQMHLCYFNSLKEIVYINMIEYGNLWANGHMYISDNNEYEVYYELD